MTSNATSRVANELSTESGSALELIKTEGTCRCRPKVGGDSRVKRILHIASSDSAGGAARASNRIHTALVDSGKVDSTLLVGQALIKNDRTASLERGRLHRAAMASIRRLLDQEVRLSATPNTVFRSPCRVATSAPNRISELQPDVVLLHWLGSRMMSIRQIGRINRPAAWVLHDSWTFCGAEHHPNGDADQRFAEGYRRDNRLHGEWGLDVNRRVWNRKRKHWTRPIHLVAPSNWMAEQASRSALVADWPVTVIPNPLDVAWWGGLQRIEARKELRIGLDVPVLLFGALGGDRNAGKGADLLYSALEKVAPHQGLRPGRTLEILTFGGRPGLRRVGPHTVRSVGHLDDDALRLHYSAADVMVVPSRLESFGQTASESITCGTPVVAFRTSGLPDIVDDGVNGRLAEPFSPASLARAIEWVLESPERHRCLSHSARSTSERWSPRLIAKRYVELFEEILEA